VLPLTPVPPQTAGERALFAELTRWDRGGAVRGAVVASIPVVDGPVGRRLSDAVLLVPEGVAVVRIVEVVRQSGVVTATPEGSWTIGPGAGPGEVLQLAGGGSTPLDGLMRAGMDAAVRLRRAGLEPGRIARLTVLTGELTGLLPADGDLGDGDQVALLEPRSLLLGISRAARYAGVDNPRLWTTADVRAALTALGFDGRGPTVEELNGEGFPYSPYVLRRRELLAPAAMAASPAMGTAMGSAMGSAMGTASPAPLADPGPVASDPAVFHPAAPLHQAAAGHPAAFPPAPAAAPPGPLVDPVAAAAVAAAAIRADEEAAARAAAGLDSAPAPVVPAAPPSRPATARFEAPALESGTGAPPAPPSPDPAPVPEPADATGGLGGLFGDDGPADAPVATPAVAPVAVPAPVAPPSVPLVGPRRRPAAARRRLVLLSVAAVLAAVVLVGLLVGLLTDDDDGAAAQETPVTSSAPAPPTTAGPTPGTRTVIEGRTFVLREVRADDTCVGNSYGEVASFFEAGDCTGLTRALWSTDVDGRPVVVSVSTVEMGETAGARDLRALADRNGSGNVSDLLREGVRYPGAPEELSGAEYASAVDGSEVTIVETAWARPGEGRAADLDEVAGDSVALPVPAPAAAAD
jgi:hypothetical protein